MPSEAARLADACVRLRDKYAGQLAEVVMGATGLPGVLGGIVSEYADDLARELGHNINKVKEPLRPDWSDYDLDDIESVAMRRHNSMTRYYCDYAWAAKFGNALPELAIIHRDDEPFELHLTHTCELGMLPMAVVLDLVCANLLDAWVMSCSYCRRRQTTVDTIPIADAFARLVFRVLFELVEDRAAVLDGE